MAIRVDSYPFDVRDHFGGMLHTWLKDPSKADMLSGALQALLNHSEGNQAANNEQG